MWAVGGAGRPLEKIHIKQNLYQGVTFHSLPFSELLGISDQRGKEGKEEERGETKLLSAGGKKKTASRPVFFNKHPFLPSLSRPPTQSVLAGTPFFLSSLPA